MNLAPGEKRTLAEIESRLSSSDPRLAEMLTHRTATGRRKYFSFRLPRWRRGAGFGRFAGAIAVIAGVALTVGVAVAGVLTLAALG